MSIAKVISSLTVVPGGYVSTAAADYPRITCPVAKQTANYSAATGDFVPCDTTSAGFTVTLPTTPAAMTVVGVMLVAGSNTLTIAAGGSDKFNLSTGPTSISLTTVNEPILLQYSSGVWYFVAAPSTFTLPTASTSTLGGVKSDGLTEQIDANGILTVTPHAVDFVQTTALPSNTYSNGSSGVGATLSWSGIYGTTGQRVLVNAEATASHNGVYFITDSGSLSGTVTLTRAIDCDTPQKIFGSVFQVKAGTLFAGTEWYLDWSSGTIVIGTSNLKWHLPQANIAQLSAPSASAGTITANSIAVNVTGTGFEDYFRVSYNGGAGWIHLDPGVTTITGLTASTTYKILAQRGVGIGVNTGAGGGSATIWSPAAEVTATTSAAGGNLYAIGVDGANTVFWKIDPATGSSTAHTQAGMGSPAFYAQSIVSDGVDLWASDPVNSKLCKITPTGTNTAYSVGATFTGEGGLVVGPDARIWLGAGFAGVIAAVTTGGTPTLYSTSPGGGANNLATDGTDIWFLDSTSGELVQSTISGSINTVAISGPYPSNNGDPVVCGPDGKFWFTDPSVAGFFQIDSSGNANAYNNFGPGPTFLPPLNAICTDGSTYLYGAGSDGDIYRCDTSGGLSQFSIGATNLNGICFGPDGNVWAVDSAGGGLYKMTPGGSVTAYTLSGSSPEGLAICPGP